MYTGFFAALVVALILTVVAVAIGRKGPWGTAWTLFLVLFFALWIVAIYTRTVGPIYYGIAWAPILIAGVLLALLLAAAIPDANHWRDESLRPTETRKVAADQPGPVAPRTGVGKFFWILIILMIMAIIIGMVNPQPAM